MKIEVKSLRYSLFSILCSLLFIACSDAEVNNKYCNMAARLTIENVQQAPVLFTACESMGEYCTIQNDGQRFCFTNAAGKTSFINESGLYALILSSKLPQAREFKR